MVSSTCKISCGGHHPLYQVLLQLFLLSLENKIRKEILQSRFNKVLVVKRLQGCNFGHISVMIMGILGKISFWLFLSRSTCNLQPQASRTSSNDGLFLDPFLGWRARLLVAHVSYHSKRYYLQQGERPGQRQDYSNLSFVLHLRRNAESQQCNNYSKVT